MTPRKLTEPSDQHGAICDADGCSQVATTESDHHQESRKRMFLCDSHTVKQGVFSLKTPLNDPPAVHAARFR